MRKRIVISIAGSDSDGPQMTEGLELLHLARSKNRIGLVDRRAFSSRSTDEFGPAIKGFNSEIYVTGHFTLSAHRNNWLLVEFLELLAHVAKHHTDTDYVLVMGAGMAAILPGLAAAILYQQYGPTNVFVVAVAFESFPKMASHCDVRYNLGTGSTALEFLMVLNQKQRRDLAALLSILEIPDNLMITGDSSGVFFGEYGFSRACKFAIGSEIPDEIREGVTKIKKKDAVFYDWEAAIRTFRALAEAK